MGVMAEECLLLLTVAFLLVSPTQSCNGVCVNQFNAGIAAAHQIVDQAARLEATCIALSRHIGCLHSALPSCDGTMFPEVNATLHSTQENFYHRCQQGPRQMGGIDCGTQYMMCHEQFNATIGPAMAARADATICSVIANYSICIEKFLAVPACIQYASHAINAVGSVQSSYGPHCPVPINPDGDMARCMNGTMECHNTFNATFFPSMRKSNMTLMCSAVANYSQCVHTLSSGIRCRPYTAEALSYIHVLEQQHKTACGEDGGRKATECLVKFKECYQHFNETFNPAVQRMDIHRLCESMDEYKVCSNGIPDACNVFLGQSLQGLDRMQAQYSQYCTPENKKIFSCSQLSQCNRNLIGNLTMTRAESGMLCVVLESYFPCVDNAVSECMLSGDGVTAVSFRKLGVISSDYCRNVLTNQDIKNCMTFMQCHAALDLNNISPTMMVEGTYWCHYMQSSLRCSNDLISAGQCAVVNRHHMLNNITSLQERTQITCTVTTPSPVLSTTTEAMTTTTIGDEPAITRGKDVSDKNDKSKDRKATKDTTKKGSTGIQTGNPEDAASSLTVSGLTLTLTFTIVSIFQRLF